MFVELLQEMRELTPVIQEDGLYIKTDDFYRPFGPHSVNGGKLRQCMALLLGNYQNIVNNYNGKVVNGCSVHSPQGAIVASVCSVLGLKSQLVVGSESFHPLVDLAERWGSEKIISPSGRHNVLYNIAKDTGSFVVAYGINLVQNREALVESISSQVENLPEDLDNLVITCGSGITSTGVLWGLSKYKKRVNNVYLVGTAPNRKRLVTDRLRSLNFLENKKMGNFSQKFNYIDLFSEKGFSYDKEVVSTLNKIVFHPNYEAKTFDWMKKHLDWKKEKTLFWVVGNNDVLEVNLKGRSRNV